MAQQLHVTNNGTISVVLQDLEGYTDFTMTIDPGETVSDDVTTDLLQRLEPQLLALDSDPANGIDIDWEVTGDGAVDPNPPSGEAPVLTRTATPPGSPSSGDRYLIIAPATGDWLGKEDYIAEWIGDSWDLVAPEEGMQLWVADEDKIYAYDGSAWVMNPTAPHALVGINHTATGLTEGHVLKATSPTTFDFQEAGYVTVTTQDLHLYANSSTGNDANDGLTPGTAKLTLAGVEAVLPDVVKHNVNIHLEGAFTAPWDYEFRKILRNKAMILVDGGDGLTVIADAGGSAWVSDINSVSSIGLSTLGWTVDQYTGYMVEIVTGPAAGEIRTIRANSATTITPCVDFSVDPGVGAEFQIVEPATTLTVNGTPFDFDQQAKGGFWCIGGDGKMVIQRMSFKGNIPVGLLGGEGGSYELYLSSCVIDKPQAAGAIGRLKTLFVDGRHGCNTDVYDPSVLGGATPILINKAGVGTVGGDGTLLFPVDVFSEWCRGFWEFKGSFCQSLGLNSTTGSILRIEGGSRAKSFSVFESLISQAYPITGAFFGGLIPNGSPFPVFPAVTVVNSSLDFGDNVDFDNSPLGLYLRRAKVRLDGATTGTGNALFGAQLDDQSALYFDNAGQVVTLTGAGGDLTFDGALPVAGGFAGVLAGTPVYDTTAFSMCKVQAALQ